MRQRVRVIDTVWVKRNLGVTCYELEMKLADNLEGVSAVLDELSER